MCVKCGAEKPQSEYYANDKSCKECRKAAVRANRLKKVDQYRQYDVERAMRPDRVQARIDYKKTEAGKVCVAGVTRRYRKENPKKYSAHMKVSNAVRDGKLLKVDSCEVCGSSFHVQAHHDDYDKPLEVRWLCAGCHTTWHDLNGEALNG